MATKVIWAELALLDQMVTPARRVLLATRAMLVPMEPLASVVLLEMPVFVVLQV